VRAAAKALGGSAEREVVGAKKRVPVTQDSLGLVLSFSVKRCIRLQCYGTGILVVKFNCELDQTRPASLRNLAKSGVETVPIVIEELRVVESIEEFGSKFQLL
jgi:hypothetical protein